jgi:hypothetical protein
LIAVKAVIKPLMNKKIAPPKLDFKKTDAYTITKGKG